MCLTSAEPTMAASATRVTARTTLLCVVATECRELWMAPLLDFIITVAAADAGPSRGAEAVLSEG